MGVSLARQDKPNGKVLVRPLHNDYQPTVRLTIALLIVGMDHCMSGMSVHSGYRHYDQ